MADFLTRAACNGIRPRFLQASGLYPRPELVSKLMRERGVARFIIAPDGFGKSLLAAEYAEIVFSFEHVFWIDAHSPCFLRDLDNASLGKSILARDGDANLVVFDRVPLLDEGRAEVFSQVADTLLSRACEVLVTMAPPSDVYAARQHDRICLFARDLLLTGEELALLRNASPPGWEYGEAIERTASSIPSIAWGRDGGSSLISGLLDDDLPARLRAWFFSTLVLRSGSLDERPLVPPIGRESRESVAQHYPFVEIDEDSREFAAIPVETEVLVKEFSTQLPSLAAQLGVNGQEELVTLASDAIFSRGRARHACRFMQSSGLRATREHWLADNGMSLLKRGAALESCIIFTSMRPRRTVAYLEACSAHIWRLALFGEVAEARELARKVSNSPYATDDAKLSAALLTSCFANASERARADASLAKLIGLNCDTTADAPLLLRHAESVQLGCNPVMSELAFLRIAQRGGVAQAEQTWLHLLSLHAPADALAVSAVWIIREYGPHACPQALDYLEYLVRERFEHESFDLVALLAANALEDAASTYPQANPMLAFDEATRSAIARARASLARQKSEFRRNHRTSSQRNGRQGAHVGAGGAGGMGGMGGMEGASSAGGMGGASLPLFSADADMLMADGALSCGDGIPVLHVKLFGGTDVHLGNRPLGDAEFRRSKSKTLLALLVLAEGHVVARERLARALWDAEITPEHCLKRNLYSVWSQLRRTLTLPDGSCPYLVKQQGGYRIDTRYVTSDITRANELCRNVALRHESAHDARVLLDGYYDIFAGGLMPDEPNNETILRLREDYRKRLVNALLSASSLLTRDGKTDDALCYATCALETDRSREDVYSTLMTVQHAAGQRDQAIETYFACRRYLATELGMDPSPSTERLYLKIISDGEPE